MKPRARENKLRILEVEIHSEYMREALQGLAETWEEQASGYIDVPTNRSRIARLREGANALSGYVARLETLLDDVAIEIEEVQEAVGK